MGKHKKRNQIKDFRKAQLMEIYNRSQSGVYTAKETCEQFNITHYTYQKIIRKIKDYISKCLNEQKTYNL